MIRGPFEGFRKNTHSEICCSTKYVFFAEWEEGNCLFAASSGFFKLGYLVLQVSKAELSYGCFEGHLWQRCACVLAPYVRTAVASRPPQSSFASSLLA